MHYTEVEEKNKGIKNIKTKHEDFHNETENFIEGWPSDIYKKKKENNYKKTVLPGVRCLQCLYMGICLHRQRNYIAISATSQSLRLRSMRVEAEAAHSFVLYKKSGTSFYKFLRFLNSTLHN